MRVLAVVVALCLLPFGALAQEGPVAERFFSITQDTDFPGADLRPIYDTTFAACSRACMADPDCHAFTFNSRNASCFPKSEVLAMESYDGAMSATVHDTDPAVLARLEARLADLTFLSATDLTDARLQAEGLAQQHYAGTWTAERILDAARARLDEGALQRAMRLYGSATTITDDPAHWMDYGRLALDIDPESRSEERNLNRTALRAAINATLRATPGDELSRAASLLARALEENDRGRDTIAALRLAIANGDSAALQQALDRAIGLYGFRVTGNRVESDTAEPRLCAILSEDLAPGVTYSDYLQTSTSGLSVDAEGQQFCVSGVQHGQRYEITLRAGLPAASGEVLRHPATLRLYVRDRTPAVRFPGRAYVLPRVSGGGLPIVTVNTDAVDLTLFAVSDRNILRSLQEDYFGRPLAEWEIDRFSTELAETVWDGTGTVSNSLNRDVTTSLPMGEVLASLDPGLYALEARVPGPANRDAPPATQWFFVSDIGISALSGADGVHVVLRALSDTSGIEGATVRLVSESNRVLAEAESDRQGRVDFSGDLAAGRNGSAPAMISVEQGDDFAFLSLREAEFDLSDRGVEGRPAAPPIDLFLTTERGAYRAGETIHATALARDGEAVALSGLPLTAVLTRADGVEYSRMVLDEVGAGGFVWQMPLGGNVPRGTWRLAVYTDTDAPPLASQTLLVEDFLPERIDVDLTLPEGPLSVARPLRLGVQSDYLFGAPAGDLPIEGSFQLRPVSTLAAYPGYSFGRHDDRPEPVYDSLPAGVRTDDTGAATLTLALPEPAGPPLPREVTVTARVSEGSGRPVERQITRAIAPTGALIGIRPLFDGTLPEATEAQFNLIAVGADALPVRWTLNRVERRYQWYSQNGRWSWEPVTTRTRIATGDATIRTAPTTIAAPADWGRYELRVESTEGDYTASSVGFSAGWYATGDSTGTPDMLDLSLDADSYDVGDEARLRIVPRSGGLVLIRVMSNRLIHQEFVTIGDTPDTFPLAVTADWGTGAYVTATLLRPLDGLPPQTPARSLGLAHASVNPASHALDVALEAPETSAPRSPLEVALRVENAAPGETVYASIAAVDVGILNLTGFQSPDPMGHYFGQRRLGVGIRDLYGRFIASGGDPGTIRQGGDATAGVRMQAPPPTEALVAFHSGPVIVGADGLARVSFDIPGFNGTVRVMAVAWNESGVGQAQTDVLVRDPVVVTASMPRFMAPGDSARLLLEVTHAQGPTGQMPIEITSSGGLSLDATQTSVMLADRETQRLRLSLVAGDQLGEQQVNVTLTTPDGQRLSRTLRLVVQSNDPVVATTSRITLAAGQGFAFDATVLQGLRDGTARAVLSAGPLARFDAPGLLHMLDRYPYGCTEQLTSQAMPLLYMADVAEALDLDHAGDLSARIQTAVDAILVNQAANGGFGLWGAYGGDAWLDAYVADFLSRARAEGYTVPDRAFRSAIDNLRNHVATAPDFEDGGESIAYALMVLAREGAAAIGDLRYYADVKADAFATPLALGQLGAALAMYGDQPRADAMFRQGYRLMQTRSITAESTGWRSDYGTRRRDAAGLLTLAAMAGSEAIPLDDLALSLPAPDTQVSTQEAVWSLLAADALIDRGGLTGLTVNGTPVDGPLLEVLEDGDQTTRTLTNTGDRAEPLTLTRYGQAEGETLADGNGYRITRRYLTLDGLPADPSQVSVGTRLVALLTVTPFSDRDARLMVSDPLPAGFEIDNPNLLRGGDIGALNDLALNDVAEHTEFRQDRFLAAVNLYGDQTLRLGYIVRAVTPGSYHHPAASVEDMYRPAFRAQTASGHVVVTE
ncbi:alpha-2-macroglobulin family protein [Nioella nitratireducens]|uniref:alpha-2-macroglobulin family protein n=1 Tax=Nioella nitratireducens TaxID=1287720 RepID=UPI0008FCF545|nr:alpha-2-macroglobulin family protein [Nioella nitratireducens]